ncbi:uncharacterized protein [Temnothorax longispinosus]|uniref:uncharacterized protein n=1 Tax=Temnothorax longispinosus TaxID=300112 RepID=UPI003A9A5FB9
MFNSSPKYQGRHKDIKKGKKWRIFQATDFQSLMYPCFTFCRILGIFPYKLNASTFKISGPQYILSTVIIAICCICTLITLYNVNIFLTNVNTFMIDRVRIPVILESDCYYVLSGFIAVITYILSGPRMRLLQSVLEISSRLSPKSYQKLSKLIHTKDILGFFYLVGHAPTYYFVMRDETVLLMTFNVYICMLVFQMDMLYVNCVCILKACFESVNNNLAQMQEFVIKNEKHVFELIYHEQQNPFLLLKLTALRKQHLKIIDTVQTLNMIFSLQLLATVVITFSEITYSLYFYVLWCQGKWFMINTKIHYAFFIPYVAHFIIKIILIVWACETNKNQALQINTTIYDVFNSTTNEQIKNEVM